ncbi:FYN-binding protein [Aix galericulata]|nr:FYN-binding protein [Aix galericulata]
MDQEKKEQKEKEKKEQEIRKKFKLTGPIQVLHQARARVDSKGGKNELTVKQGDQIEIIRLTDNPEGKWLGRIKGCFRVVVEMELEDEDKNDTWSWGILKKLKVKDNKKKSVREKTTKVNGAEDNGDFSPKPVNLGKGKSDEKDPQKLKKMEREEKEFRKKFKFEDCKLKSNPED